MMGGRGIIDRSMIVLIVFLLRLRYCQVWQISNYCYCSLSFILLRLVVLLTHKHKFCIEMLLLLRFYLFFCVVCILLVFIFSVMFYFANYHQVNSDPLLSFCCVFCSTPYNFYRLFCSFLLFVIVLVSFSDCHCCIKLGIL